MPMNTEDMERWAAWDKLQREKQKMDAEKSRGLLGGLSGLGTLPASFTKEEYEKARKLMEVFDKKAPGIGKRSPKGCATEPDIREKYSGTPEYKNGIKALEKSAADFCLKNDIDMDSLFVIDEVHVEYSTITNCDILQLRYRLEYAGKAGPETHLFTYTTKIL